MIPTTFASPCPARGRSLALACLLTALSTGCALMRKDVAPLPTIPPDQVRLAEDLKLGGEGWPEAEWWHGYQDPQLDALIAQAIQGAPALVVARNRVEASRSYTSWVDASRGPLLGLSAEMDREYVSGNGFLGPYHNNIPMEGLTGPWYSEGTVGLKGGTDLDVWGRDRARVRAALGLENAQRAEEAQAELILAARVAQVYFSIQALHATVDVLEQIRTVDSELVRAHTARGDRGLEPRTPTALAQARELELGRQLRDAKDRIRLLQEALRAMIGAGPDRLQSIHPVDLPRTSGKLPASLDYELLSRRPDLQAMRWYVQASLRQVDAARAAFYPSFDLRVFFGYNSIHTDDLFKNTSRQANIIPGLSLPLFDSGRLNANLANARTQSNTLIAQYNQAVVEAVREVAQAGIGLESLGQQLDFQTRTLEALTFAQRSTEAQAQAGLADQLAVLESRLPVLAQRIQEIQLRDQELRTEVQLIMALGGGYQAHTTQAPASKPAGGQG